METGTDEHETVVSAALCRVGDINRRVAVLQTKRGVREIRRRGGGGKVDPALFEKYAKEAGVAGKFGAGGGAGSGGFGDGFGGADLGKYGENAMKRPGYSDFDPAKFRADMKASGKWDK